MDSEVLRAGIEQELIEYARTRKNFYSGLALLCLGLLSLHALIVYANKRAGLDYGFELQIIAMLAMLLLLSVTGRFTLGRWHNPLS